MRENHRTTAVDHGHIIEKRPATAALDCTACFFVHKCQPWIVEKATHRPISNPHLRALLRSGRLAPHTYADIRLSAKATQAGQHAMPGKFSACNNPPHRSRWYIVRAITSLVLGPGTAPPLASFLRFLPAVFTHHRDSLRASDQPTYTNHGSTVLPGVQRHSLPNLWCISVSYGVGLRPPCYWQSQSGKQADPIQQDPGNSPGMEIPQGLQGRVPLWQQNSDWSGTQAPREVNLELKER